MGTGLRCAPPTCVVNHQHALSVHNVALCRLGGAQDDFACSLLTFFDGVQCIVVSLSGTFFNRISRMSDGLMTNNTSDINLNWPLQRFLHVFCSYTTQTIPLFRDNYLLNNIKSSRHLML